MGVESGRISLEVFQEQLANKHRQWKAMLAITDGFGGDVSYPQKSAEQQREKERIESEVVELAAESLAVLGFDPVMENIYRVMGSAYVHYHDKARLLSKILRYVTEKKLVSTQQSAGEPDLDPSATRDLVAAALQEEPAKEKRRFEDCVSFDTPVSSRQAIDILLAFHSNSTEAAILNAFSQLRNFTGTVIFTRDVQNGSPCVCMSGLDKRGDHLWNKRIFRDSGQPIQTVG